MGPSTGVYLGSSWYRDERMVTAWPALLRLRLPQMLAVVDAHLRVTALSALVGEYVYVSAECAQAWARRSHQFDCPVACEREMVEHCTLPWPVVDLPPCCA